MRAALWILLLFAVAVAVALGSRFDQGYVLVAYPPWRLEVSLIFAIVVLGAVFVALYAGIHLLSTALHLPADVRAWRRRRRSDKIEDRFSRALAALISGQPAHARQLAEAVLKKERLPLAALIAARAALDQGDRVAAQDFLREVTGDVGELIAARQAIEAALADSALLPPPGRP